MKNYTSLQKLMQEQISQYKKWEYTLTESAFKLKRDIAGDLGIDGREWENSKTGEKLPYVTLFDISKKPPVQTRLRPAPITHLEELIVGIAVGFNAQSSSPLEYVIVPIALRYEDNEVNYSLYVDWSDSRDWTVDVEEFRTAIIEEIEKHLSYDPLEGINSYESKITRTVPAISTSEYDPSAFN